MPMVSQCTFLWCSNQTLCFAVFVTPNYLQRDDLKDSMIEMLKRRQTVHVDARLKSSAETC